LVSCETIPLWAYAFEDSDEGDGGFEVELCWEAPQADDISGGGVGVDIGGFGDDGFDVVLVFEVTRETEGDSRAHGPAVDDGWFGIV